jgi:hypothetical protein
MNTLLLRLEQILDALKNPIAADERHDLIEEGQSIVTELRVEMMTE